MLFNRSDAVSKRSPELVEGMSLSLYRLPDGKVKNDPKKEKPRNRGEALPISITPTTALRLLSSRALSSVQAGKM